MINSGLSQKQSASINSGNILTIGNGSIATDNKQYKFIWRYYEFLGRAPQWAAS